MNKSFKSPIQPFPADIFDFWPAEDSNFCDVFTMLLAFDMFVWNETRLLMFTKQNRPFSWNIKRGNTLLHV